MLEILFFKELVFGQLMLSTRGNNNSWDCGLCHYLHWSLHMTCWSDGFGVSHYIMSNALWGNEMESFHFGRSLWLNSKMDWLGFGNLALAIDGFGYIVMMVDFVSRKSFCKEEAVSWQAETFSVSSEDDHWLVLLCGWWHTAQSSQTVPVSGWRDWLSGM